MHRRQLWTNIWNNSYPAAPALLFTWYALLTLYIDNAAATSIDYLWRPLFLATFITIVSYSAVLALTKQPIKAGLIIWLLVLTFFSYIHLKSLVEMVTSQTLSPWLVGGLYLALYAAAGFLAVKYRRWPLQKGLQILSAVSLVLVIGAIIQIIPIQSHHRSIQSQTINNIEQLPTPKNQQPATSNEQPDIYYLVLDRYASSKTLADYYQYDNSDFDTYLTDQGFYLARDSLTNYPKTLFSLPSTLNLDYLQQIIDTTNPDNSDANTATTLLSHHKVGRMLQQAGYTYYHLGNSYELTRSVDIADLNVLPKSSDFAIYSSYAQELLKTTYYPEIALRWWPNLYPQSAIKQHPLWADFQFDQLQQSVNWSGPKFVMAHLLMPHDPYVYDSQCNLLPVGLERWQTDYHSYTDQVTCANQRVRQAIDTILSQSTTPPIIILQSDEGPEAMVDRTGHHWNFAEATDRAINQRTQILNAYYFPDKDYSQLYQTITPVNTFRTIFRQYFNYDLPNLPDTTYLWPDQDHLYDFYPYPGEK